MDRLAPFVFMGGTFDPIHNGHLRSALEIAQWLDVQQLSLIPSQQPVHRGTPGCTAGQRLEMVARAVASEATLIADDREISSAEPSYTILTLQQLRQELGVERPLCKVMGMDAFLGLPGWHRWTELLDYCHLIVVKRPGYQLEPCDKLAAVLQQSELKDVSELRNSAAGGILIHEQTPLEISATQVRTLIKRGLSPRYLIPDQVWDYIQTEKLYGFNEEI